MLKNCGEMNALAESFYLKNLSLIPNLQEGVRNSQLFITSYACAI